MIREDASYQEYMRVKPFCIIVYRKVLGGQSRPPPPKKKTKEDNRTLSRRAKTRIMDKSRIWSQCVKNAHRRHVLVTLTLTSRQKHEDVFIKRKMLNGFLIQMKREGAQEYLWKAERQKNGNIHFHILTDSYVSHERIRILWLRQLKRQGYRADMINRQRYPCTDVRQVNDENVTGYLTKYITKDTEGIEGRLWYMTRRLSRLKYPDIELQERILVKGDTHLIITEKQEMRRLLNAVGYFIDWDSYYHCCARMVYNVW